MPLPHESEQAKNQPANDAKFIQVFQQLEGGAKVEETDISQWINSDSDFGHQVLKEDKNVCTANIESDTSEDEDNTDEPIGSTHGEATTTLEGLMT